MPVEEASRFDRLFRNGHIGRAGRDNGDVPFWILHFMMPITDNAGHFVVLGQGNHFPDGDAHFGGDTARQHIASLRVHPFGNLPDLVGGLPGGIDHFGNAGATHPIGVDRREPHLVDPVLRDELECLRQSKLAVLVLF